MPYRILKWNTPIMKASTLKDLTQDEDIESIKSDLKLLRASGLLPKGKEGSFVKTFEPTPYDVFIYEHQQHTSFSAITFEQVGMIAEVHEHMKLLRSCTTCDQHDWCLPFLFGNNHLKQMLLDKISNGGDADTLAFFHKMLNDNEIFNSSVPEDCSSYNKDLWSKRLAKGLSYQGIICHCLAELRGTPATTKAITERLPKGASIKSCVFRGAPDIIIENQVPPLSEDTSGIISIAGAGDHEEEEEVHRDESGSDSDNSGRVQMGFQLPGMKPYQTGSFISNKAGELVGAIHASLVTRALKRCSSGKMIKDMVGHGLFVHKMIGIVHLKVSLSSGKMQVDAYRIAGGNLDANLLCSAVSYFMNELKEAD